MTPREMLFIFNICLSINIIEMGIVTIDTNWPIYIDNQTFNLITASRTICGSVPMMILLDDMGLLSIA